MKKIFWFSFSIITLFVFSSLNNAQVFAASQVSTFEPEVVEIPSGSFSMGCDGDCDSDNSPKHTVNISSFLLAKYETTFDQWDACVADKGCSHVPDDAGWGRGNRPVMNVSSDNIIEYLKWLSSKTGQVWRLPTEAEWEYAARAGSDAYYAWGNDAGKNNANCDGCGSEWDRKQTAPVGSFKANKFGIHDMHGNVWEWVQDWYAEDYYSKSPATDPKGPSSGSLIVGRGGSWKDFPEDMFADHRSAAPTNAKASEVGFRVVKVKAQSD